MSMNFKRKLPIPKLVKEQYPVSEEMAKIKQANDNTIKDIFEGKSEEEK